MIGAHELQARRQEILAHLSPLDGPDTIRDGPDNTQELWVNGRRILRERIEVSEDCLSAIHAIWAD